jgi:hypothetical protein
MLFKAALWSAPVPSPELQLNLHRDLVDDLLAGTDDDKAYARTEALGYDLRRPHDVAVIHAGRSSDNSGLTATGGAAGKLHLDHLLGRQASWRTGCLQRGLPEGAPDAHRHDGARHHYRSGRARLRRHRRRGRTYRPAARSRRAGGSLGLTKSPRQLRRLFQLVGMKDKFTIVEQVPSG